MEIPGFSKNLHEAKAIRAKNPGPFTSSELTVDAAMSALNVASLDGQDPIEIKRRADLIKNSAAYASASQKDAR